MARIRTIKPELPQSETIGSLSRDARLLFIQLFTIADDAGRARAASRLLASLLYPYDHDAADLIDGWLGELEGKRCIRRYEADGSQYLEIVKWLDHQKIDKPSPSRLPVFRETSSNPREPSRTLDTDLVPSISTKDLDHSAAASPPPTRQDKKSHSNRTARGTRIPPDWRPNQADWLAAKNEGFSESEIEREVLRFRDYWVGRAGAGGVKLDWPATWRNWMRTSAEKLGKTPVRVNDPDATHMFEAKMASEELDAWDAYSKAKTGKTFPRNQRGGWLFPTQWPPGYTPIALRQALELSMQSMN